MENIAQPGQPSVASGAASTRLLIVTHTAGYRHECIPLSEKIIAALGERSGAFTVDFCRDANDVQTMLAAERLANYDGAFFANTTGDLGIPDLPAFLGWIEAGGAFIGAHAAADTYHNEPSYLAMIGGEFKTHGDQCEVEVNVDDAAHPAVAHLAPRFTIYEEIYEFTANERADKNVLLSLDRHPPDGHGEAGQPGDYLLAWTKTHGQGRVFYTALGHRDDVWQSDRFQTHLLEGIRWALEK